VLATRTSQSVDLSRPVPITLAYLTAWVDEAGALQFREDVYGRDGRDEAVLAAVQTACGA
jgi:murein L,D-transpeptidase YcbB/YkuD